MPARRVALVRESFFLGNFEHYIESIFALYLKFSAGILPTLFNGKDACPTSLLGEELALS